ncbi:MAG: hypothetical protein B9J98_07500 [Candidatus Terraquivivens tikiterensis]|uniref:Uncharacterized protein n=1 Tax=Candidatus Terraquivivens tikiterensis TaxID=1980982 RepID=A0A2R7Y0Q3_9ARCH|nr:MAG: hypothetical protein B9J98_07500 [Candidatus Terraquivivens tikiterensis]
MSALKQHAASILMKVLGFVIIVFGSIFLYWLAASNFVLSAASGLVVFILSLLIFAGIILLFF